MLSPSSSRSSMGLVWRRWCSSRSRGLYQPYFANEMHSPNSFFPDGMPLFWGLGLYFLCNPLVQALIWKAPSRFVPSFARGIGFLSFTEREKVSLRPLWKCIRFLLPLKLVLVPNHPITRHQPQGSETWSGKRDLDNSRVMGPLGSIYFHRSRVRNIQRPIRDCHVWIAKKSWPFFYGQANMFL